MAKWLLKQNRVDTAKMAASLGISETTATVLANRGVGTSQGAWDFLQAPLSAIRDPKTMKGFSEGVKLVGDCIRQKKRFTVYGDYDVDGVSSTVILTKAIRDCGGLADTYTPSRHTEGYGLRAAAVEALAERGTEVLFTCDNGIAAAAEIALAKERGMTVVVLDHHEGRTPPLADACIDPKQPDCPYPFKQLCAGGISYLFAMALYAEMGVCCPRPEELLAFAALATVCDIVDLLEENRILAKNGLAVMDKTGNLGLNALLAETGLQGKPFTEYHAGFVVGPCINAAGRLETAEAALGLFFTEDPAQAQKLAQSLAALNEERKRQTETAACRVLEQIRGEDKVLVHYDPEIPEGVIGIVAGRVKEKLHRPVILLTGTEGGAKGSGRSIEAYHMYQGMLAHQELFLQFGGHAMAAGLTLPLENIDALRAGLNEDCTLEEKDFVPTYRIERALRGNELTLGLAKELAALAPFGKGNPSPIFGVKDLILDRVSFFGKEKKYLRLMARDQTGCRFTAMSFTAYEGFMETIKGLNNPEIYEKIRKGAYIGVPFDMLIRLEAEVYMDRESLRIRMVDFRFRE